MWSMIGFLRTQVKHKSARTVPGPDLDCLKKPSEVARVSTTPAEHVLDAPSVDSVEVYPGRDTCGSETLNICAYNEQ